MRVIEPKETTLVKPNGVLNKGSEWIHQSLIPNHNYLRGKMWELSPENASFPDILKRSVSLAQFADMSKLYEYNHISNFVK